MTAIVIRRGFADVGDGQVHYRVAGPPPGAPHGTPLVMLHPSPGSSKMLEPLIRLCRQSASYQREQSHADEKWLPD